jgi:acyl carrier protein
MSNVTLDEFAEKFANELLIDIDTLLTNNLSDITQYDSMGKINISLLIEELFDFQIEYEDLNSAETIATLYQICMSRQTND